MKKLLFLFFTAFLGFSAIAQSSKGFELTVKINGYPEGQGLRLGRYYGDNQRFVDTAVFDKRRGVYVFKRDQPLDGGMYMLVSYENTPAELIIDQNQQFSVEVGYPFEYSFGMVTNMTFKNSVENQVYTNLNSKLRPLFADMQNIQKEFDLLEDKASPEAERLIKKRQSILENVEKIRTQFMQDNPKHLMTAVFRAQKDIEVPEAPADIPENERQLWRYNYYMNHFFDNMDLATDDRLLRTPIFHQRLERYLELLSPHPDSIKFGIERLVEKTRGNPELFRYVVITTTNRYLQTQIVGYDAIWVYLLEKYYLSGDAVWASEAAIENFRTHVARTKPLLIGNRPAEFLSPEINLENSNEQWRSVFEPRTRYTIVMFWEPNCGHCKKQMPLLRDFYNEKREELDFEVFAVCRDNDIERCKNYINANGITNWINVDGRTSNVKFDELWDITSSPTIYVLDSQKRIVTKRIEVDQIEPFIRNWNALYYGEK